MYVIYIGFYFSVFRAVTLFCGHNCTHTSKSTTENNCLNALVTPHWCPDLQFLKDFIFLLGFNYKWPYMVRYYRNLIGDGVLQDCLLLFCDHTGMREESEWSLVIISPLNLSDIARQEEVWKGMLCALCWRFQCTVMWPWSIQKSRT